MTYLWTIHFHSPGNSRLKKIDEYFYVPARSINESEKILGKRFKKLKKTYAKIDSTVISYEYTHLDKLIYHTNEGNVIRLIDGSEFRFETKLVKIQKETKG